MLIYYNHKIKNKIQTRNYNKKFQFLRSFMKKNKKQNIKILQKVQLDL